MRFLNYTAFATGLGVVATLAAGTAFADSIDPTSYTADLAVGESVTIEKTVVISEGTATSALIDIHFLMDTSGSMGGEIATAKAAAADLFTALDSRGDVAAGVGVFSENAVLVGETCTTFCSPTNPTGAVPGTVINSALTTDSTVSIDAINDITLSTPDGGGDFPENGYDAIWKSAENLEWRPGSNRFMFIFTDASAKGDQAAAAAALAADGIDLYTLSYGSLSTITASYGTPFGATVLPSSTTTEELIADILEGIDTSLATYSEVTVGDLGAGLPGIEVSTVCTDAESGVCNGAVAEGDYDRSVERTFTFDVTFTRMAEGDTSFETYALVDGGAVARETDRFPGVGGEIPLPATAWLMLGGFGAIAGAARRRKA